MGETIQPRQRCPRVRIHAASVITGRTVNEDKKKPSPSATREGSAVAYRKLVAEAGFEPAMTSL